MREKKSNPFELKELGKPSKDYLDTDDFAEFLIKKKIIVRKDNLPRFADTHGIKMAKKKREGSGGSVPTIYKIPTKTKLEEIIKTMSLSNNNALGKENINLYGKNYETEHFTIKSKDMSLPKDKRLDLDVWYDQNNSIILKVSYSMSLTSFCQFIILFIIFSL